MRKLLKENPLFSVFLIPAVADVIFTVVGQPKEYWTSGYKVFSEAAPVYVFLQIHPLLFIFTTLIIWLPFTYWLTKKLRSPFNVWATMALLIGHGYNSVAWLRKICASFGLFNAPNQLSRGLSMIPMTIYIFFIAWFATKGLIHYFKK
jgi:membrane-associated HD superfamily phosphohydrolase